MFREGYRTQARPLMNYIELGRAYAQMGRTTEAKQIDHQGMAMKETEKDDSRDQASRRGRTGGKLPRRLNPDLR